MKHRIVLIMGLYAVLSPAIANAEMPAIRLIAPGDGWEVSRIAADFRWANLIEDEQFWEFCQKQESVPVEGRQAVWHLQLAGDTDFVYLIWDKELPHTHWKQNAGQRYIPEELVPAGEYFWRVRAIGLDGTPGAWSAARRFKVVEKNGTAPLVREISAQRPLLLVGQRVGMRGDGNPYGPVTFTDESPSASKPALPLNLIPDDLRPYLGLFFWRNVLGHNIEDMRPYYDAARDAGIAAFARGTWSLSEIEWAYKNYPQAVIGVQMDEMGGWWTYYPEMYRRFLERAVRLSAAYGRYYLQAEGDYRALPFASLLEEPRWMDFMREYGKYTIWGGKTNISPVLHATQGLYRGLWLDGVIGNYCVWGEGFFWDHAGFKRLGECGTYRQYWKEGAAGYYPGIMWPQTFTVGAAQGASVYIVSGWQLLWDEGLDPPQPIWMHYTLPLLKSLVEKELIATRREALAATKLAVEVRDVPKTRQPSLYSDYDPLFRNTYGLNFPGSDYSDLIPDNGRYYFVPLASPLTERASDKIRTLKLDDIDTAESVHQWFDAAYPSQAGGDAWVCRVGDKFYIQNSNENRDIDQSFDLSLIPDGVRRIRGPIHLHTYLVGKTSDDGQTVWLQANSHHRTESRAHGRFVVEASVRKTVVTFACARPPRVSVDPAGDLVSHEVADAGRLRTLRLSHAKGAVEVTVRCPPREEPEFGAVPPQQQSDFCRSLEPCGRILALEDWDTWGCSPIDGPDGKTHVFFARWPSKDWHEGWYKSCEIAHAVADRPEGPYRVAGTAMKGQPGAFAPHNPTIHQVGDRYALLYITNQIGDTWSERSNPKTKKVEQVRFASTQQIRLALADSLDGPFRCVDDKTILDKTHDPKHWDCDSPVGVNNPALLQHPNGQFWLYYKAAGADGIRRMGLAVADRIEGPYERYGTKPVVGFDGPIEDEYVFIEDGKFHMICTDNHGRFMRQGGLHLISDDGIHWPVCKQGYQPGHYYGMADWYGYLGRPQILMRDGHPAYLFVAQHGGQYGRSTGTVLRCERGESKKECVFDAE